MKDLTKTNVQFCQSQTAESEKQTTKVKKKNQRVQSSEINMQCDIETAHSLLVTSCMQMIPIIHEQ